MIWDDSLVNIEVLRSCCLSQGKRYVVIEQQLSYYKLNLGSSEEASRASEFAMSKSQIVLSSSISSWSIACKSMDLEQ